MTGKGIRLTKLRASGDGKDDAGVEFKPGLNVIAYMSQTGKSYILECINFLMGGKTLPRKIKQSKGYETLWLEFIDSSGAPHVLMRTTNGDDFRHYSVPLEQVKTSTSFKKLAKSAGAQSSASILIAELSGFPRAKLKANKWNEKANLSFRTISHFFIVDEISMIGDLSPINARGGFSLTTERSAFKYLITGGDDNDLEQIEGPTAEQLAVAIGRDMLQKLIDQFASELKERQAKTNTFETSDADEQLSARAAEIEETTTRIRAQESERRSAWNAVQERESRLLFLSELLARFALLRSHYESDLKRLDFIGEGQHYLDQLESVSCPFCGTPLQDHSQTPCDPGSGITFESLQSAYVREAEKIRQHIADLESTVGVLTEERTGVAAVVGSIHELIRGINEELSSNLSPRLTIAKEAIQTLVQQRSESMYLRTLGDQLEALQAERNEMGDGILDVADSAEGDVQVYINQTATTEFCEMMRALLERWRFLQIGAPVEFDASKFDFLIDGQGRIDNGKGVRALIHSAFNVALMQFCLAKNLPHPGFVILDSPLTTFKERGQAVRPENLDEVTGEVQAAFFDDLAKSQPDEQVIVLENKPPPAGIGPRCHYIEFVGYELPGRTGFFPVQKVGLG
jgi:hypothetical protein